MRGSGRPRPHQRPGITLSISGDPEARKSWKTVDVESVRHGDIVRGLGLVMAVKWWADPERGGRLEFKSGKVESYQYGDKVIAFTFAEGTPVG